ncbi:hypothetical protein CK214_24580 [Mesorhizobium sp. WSM3882]|nr:hypothetical protein CK214_24580 [Mesorhizobium sp. WSM3882]
MHVCIGDASTGRLLANRADEKKESAVAFPQGCSRLCAGLGITVDRVMTDNGPCYRFKAFAKACRKLGRKPHIEPTLNPLAKIAGFYCADQEGFSIHAMDASHPNNQVYRYVMMLHSEVPAGTDRSLPALIIR